MIKWFSFMCIFAVANGKTEAERVAEHIRRNYTWPINDDLFIPPTKGWRELMQHRLRQVNEIEDQQDRFEGFVQTLSSAIIQKNYTTHGFGVVRAPDDLMEALREGIHKGVQEGPRNETYINAISGDRPWFIDRPDLTQRVLKELQLYPETWAGMELTPYVAYGFRLYRNDNELFVHVDKSETHVISFILHIDSSEDAEPWPILIEDYQGNTHEVILTSGDILLYESSKCFHGRPRPFKGSWYSSVFVHYYPKYGYRENFDTMDKVYAVPLHWAEPPTTHYEIPLTMHGTTMEETSCPNKWCMTQHSKRWSGPGEVGYILHPNGEKKPFHPKKIPCVDEDDRCSDFASWQSNECQKNPNFMHKFCKKSCGLCTVDPLREEL